MTELATVLGFLAVALFVFSYQMKTRRYIIALGAASRVLYVTQYILLGAYEGALLDIVGFFISLVCSQTERGFVKKHFWPILILSNLVILAVGAFTYKNIFSLLAIFGVFFETLALWLKKERHIRIVSIFAAPCWLLYNFQSRAYGSVVGNVITLVSLAVAILRYDVLKKEKKEKAS